MHFENWVIPLLCIKYFMYIFYGLFINSREGPSELLKDFKGHLQTDGYAAYNIFDQQKDVTLLHCMAHARRKFVEAQLNDAGRAEYALSQFQLLYAIKRRAADQRLTHEQILQLRQQEAVPILEALGK